MSDNELNEKYFSLAKVLLKKFPRLWLGKRFTGKNDVRSTRRWTHFT